MNNEEAKPLDLTREDGREAAYSTWLSDSDFRHDKSLMVAFNGGVDAALASMLGTELSQAKSKLMQWEEIWGPVLDFAQKNKGTLGIKLGESISASILSMLKQRAALGNPPAPNPQAPACKECGRVMKFHNNGKQHCWFCSKCGIMVDWGKVPQALAVEPLPVALTIRVMGSGSVVTTGKNTEWAWKLALREVQSNLSKDQGEPTNKTPPRKFVLRGLICPVTTIVESGPELARNERIHVVEYSPSSAPEGAQDVLDAVYKVLLQKTSFTPPFALEVAEAIAPALRQAPSPLTCAWKENEEGTWETDCDNAFVLEAETPSKNEMKFCAYCGKVLRESKYETPED